MGFGGEPALSGLTGTAAGQRVTTDCYIAIPQNTIRSWVVRGGTYVPVIHRSIHRGERYADVRKGTYARRPRYLRMLVVSSSPHL